MRSPSRPRASSVSGILRYLAHPDRERLFVGYFALLPLGLLVGQHLIPSHWTSIWNDTEFSGWVAPIANRLSHGPRLSADVGHSPMPALPLVLVSWLTGGHAPGITRG